MGGLAQLLEARPKVFDLKSRWFWIGEEPVNRADAARRQVAVPFARIRAVQLLSKESTGDEHFQSFELNLVLKNAERLHVVCHGNEAAMLQDAHRVASHIDVPVWDARTDFGG